VSDNICLKVKNITKSFPGVKALDNITVDFKEGEVHAIIGENGAGKSTFMKIISGIHKPDKGNIYYMNDKVEISNPIIAKKLGISMVHQELNLCKNKSVMENIFMGREPTKKIGIIDWEHLTHKSKKIIDQLKIDIEPKDRVSNLSIGQKQMVEIARAIVYESKIVIFDEPTTSLTSRERETLFSTIFRLKRRGVSVIYISHKMEEIMEIADRVTVLRNGKLIFTKSKNNISIDDMVNAMIGKTVNYFTRSGLNHIKREKILEVKDITRKNSFKSISFEIFKGEIVGMAGLVGAGRTEIARCIFGLDDIDSGKILFKGKECINSSPQKAIAMGIGLIPEDRKTEGIISEMTVSKNITLPLLDEISRLSIINKTYENKIANKYIENLDIKIVDLDQKAKFLSGGNQQKIVIGKCLATKPELLILDEPTKGIDVGAKNEIYKLMNKLTKEGVAILMISSDLKEVLRMSDRILVIKEGQINARLSCAEANQETIIRYCTSNYKTS